MEGRGVIHPDILEYEEEIAVIRAERQRIYDNMGRVSEDITSEAVAEWDEIIVNMVLTDLNRHWTQYQSESGRLVDALMDAESQRLVREGTFGVAREYA